MAFKVSDFPLHVQAEIQAKLNGGKTWGMGQAKAAAIRAIEVVEPSPVVAPAKKKRVRKPAAAKSSAPDHNAEFFVSVGLSGFVQEHRFHDVRKWRFDFAWTAQKVALEIEGGAWTGGRHTRGAGFIADMLKYNTATELGWRILRFTPDQVRTTETARMIAAVLKISQI